MKILVVSDTHGMIDMFLSAIKDKKFDMLIHLGDYVGDGIKIGKELNVPTTIVRGNGDFDLAYKEDEVLEIEGKRIFLTHGHLYNVRNGVDSLYYRGKELGADMVLFGHTHVPLNLVEDGLIIMNPGSPSFPRLNIGQIDSEGPNKRRFTYGIINIDMDISGEIMEIE